LTERPTGYSLTTMTDPNGPTDPGDEGFIRIDTADARSVARVRNELSLWLRSRFDLDAARLNDVLLAVNEALTNAAEFAYPGRRGTMTMQARYDAPDRTLSVDVSDCGTWRQTDPNLASNTRGRGIPLMRALADRATISQLPTGTRVQLRFGNIVPVGAQACAAPA
jgi:serine/threonine-protein kinase RsbW